MSEASTVMPAPARAKAALAIDLAAPSALWRHTLPDGAAQARRAARAAVASSGAALGPAAELAIILGDDALVRALNRRWRGRDAPTNVLAFASEEQPGAGRPLLLGDVVLAYETVAAEAAAQGKPLADHLAHLVAHGVLHLLGFDHDEPAAAKCMEALERRVLARIGIPDPYAEREGRHG